MDKVNEFFFIDVEGNILDSALYFKNKSVSVLPIKAVCSVCQTKWPEQNEEAS